MATLLRTPTTATLRRADVLKSSDLFFATSGRVAAWECCSIRTQPPTSRPRPAESRRFAHTRRHVSVSALDAPPNTAHLSDSTAEPPVGALGCLPLSTLIRSYLITAVSSNPVLLRPSLTVLSYIAHSESRILNPDTSPIVRLLLKPTFYAQFCAGETPEEVASTLTGLKNTGYYGAILAHAREVVLEGDDVSKLDESQDSKEQDRCNREDIATWEKSTLDTIALAQPGDFVALKFSGAGRQALQTLSHAKACVPALEEAVHNVCRLSESKGIRLLFDAEQAMLQPGIDRWTMYFMKRYNKGSHALVYGTYQAYAKKTPEVLARHLEEAQTSGYVLGVKLVRGAYLGSDPRELFWPTIEDTHKCYNSLAESLIKRKYGGILKPVQGSSGEFPEVNLVLATHNAESVANARRLREEQAAKGEPRIEMAYGQLMGMADNVSCALVQVAKEAKELASEQKEVEIPRAYKYLVWGTVGECLKYLLRRAHENRDAVTRTAEARRALGQELARRFGLAR